MDDYRLLISRVDDLVYKSYTEDYVFLGFINELEVSQVHNYLNKLKVEHSFYGGYPNASRVFLYIGDAYTDYSEIKALRIILKGKEELSHRDFLGSLMGLGISRESVGDIVLINDGAVAFVRSEVYSYIIDNLTSVGRQGVKLSEYNENRESLGSLKEETEILLTSMRVDNFITSVCKCSRQTAIEYIENDKVFVNYSCVSKPSKTLDFDDIVSIRGFGKYKIGAILRKTKSDRIVLSVLQYK